MSHCILISLGTNIDKEANTKRGLDMMVKRFGSLEVSTVYESEAVGFEGNAFINLVAKATTHLSISDVVNTLKQIEKDCGRVKQTKKFCDRILDLDLLTYDDLVTKDPIVLPREEVLYNAFVLRPMADLVPEMEHPVVHKTYRQLWQEYDKQQHLWPISLEWSQTPA